MLKGLYTINLQHVSMQDVARVGGKNASLGEMIQHLSAQGIQVPLGFATTSTAFHDFLEGSLLHEKISTLLEPLDVDDVVELARVGKMIRELILQTPLSMSFEQEVRLAYAHLEASIGHPHFSVAVRSSATAEDLPDASFAGQQETYLNVHGIDDVLQSIVRVFASLYNDRAIAYRVHQGFSTSDLALSVGVQQMIRSDLAASGVMFTLDTESGFDQVIFITSSYGLGEMVVQGGVNPDEFYVYKPGLREGHDAVVCRNLGSKLLKMIYAEKTFDGETVRTVAVDEASRRQFSLSSPEIEQLARYALLIESHYACPMDIEWAKDGVDGKLYILQARPETVNSRANAQVVERYTLSAPGTVLAVSYTHLTLPTIYSV